MNNGTGNSTVITGTPEPAISSATFQGKHTKFKQEDSDNESKKITKQDEKNIRKNTPDKLTKKDKSKGKVTKPNKEKKSKASK